MDKTNPNKQETKTAVAATWRHKMTAEAGEKMANPKEQMDSGKAEGDQSCHNSAEAQHEKPLCLVLS